ncbi:AMP-binding protein [Pseudonocardia kunmingensis]|uniref:AMP-binding protein n=1 Tax=Pseudonocardia kunmingensis TaxID=630975 RepID=UPI00147886A8|nr:AMP-binding protein [Pseudonocardia kunmingensis]
MTSAATTGPGARRWIEATTLGDLLDRRAVERPDDDAVVFPDARASYAELAGRAQWFARRLAGLGVRRGDRVGILLPATVDLLAVLFGAAKLGAIAVPVNARFKCVELAQIVAHSGMRVLVTDAASTGLLHETFPGVSGHAGGELGLADAPELRHVLVLDGTEVPDTEVRDTAAPGVQDDVVWESQASVRVRDTAVIVYTSGTTAAPKGAMLSHEALVRLPTASGSACRSPPRTACGPRSRCSTAAASPSR